MSTDKKRQPTSFDVAKLAGVHRSAVSRAFTPGAAVAEETRKKIYAAASELNYRVNSIARGLQSEHSGIVGILASRLDTPVRAKQVKLLTQPLIRDGFRPMLVTAETPADVGGLIDAMLGYNVAGVIVTSDSPPQRAIDECHDAGVPVVLINRAETGAWADRVITDPEASGRLAFDMLRRCGASRMAVLQPETQTFSVTGRAAAFAALATARLGGCGRFLTADQSYDAARRSIATAGHAAFDAVDGLFCATDLLALGAVDALRLDLGLSVPNDIQVVGFDDIEQASWGAYSLTTVRQDLEAQAQLALRLLKVRMAQNDAPAQCFAIDLKPIFRGTTQNVD
ncbi:LacI family DNA-binding transcriptional regulator [Gymnodinialimonas sp. 2305UL16-5]|uniref:LacI family DNA-binding transcriptional regulator n=1 Tax=Gymnodinialimonas mytili TaxID=3126503 RepID=UPI0030A976C7